MERQLHSHASARLRAGEVNEAGGHSGMETTMLVNNPHNLIGGKANGGFDEF